MLISDISVKRPVFASVISLILIAFGLVSFQRLSLREYPDIDPPVVTVEVSYPGAPANIVETRITKLLEERIAGIEGIEYVESSSQDGEASVTIEFAIDRDIDGAANDVRDRISGIQDNLPEEAEPPEVQKVDSNDDVIIWRNLASDRHSIEELTDYAERYLVDRYSTLDGVARIRIGGGLRYAMRVWLDRQELAARGLSVSDVEDALRAENVELPAGSLESDVRLFKARVDRKFKEPEDFGKLVLAEGDDGYLIRLADVARVELGVEENRIMFRGNEVPMVGIGTIKQSTANTIDVARQVKALTAEINKSLPEGMSIEESYDASVFIEEAIHEVYTTLFIAIGCVIVVIYLFLGSVRATLVPAVTVPVSVIATFIVVYSLGFSINLLTLLALVLAIGLVVDDAIVMLENIVRRIQELGEPPLLAAYRGARQVGFAVIATTLVLVAVFVPITFLEGDIGRLFTEFALTIAAAVCFSSLVALTLSPMLASKVLSRQTEPNFLVRGIDATIRFFRTGYLGALRFCLRVPLLVVAVFVGLLALIALVYSKVPQEFAPTEDRGVIFLLVNGPEGATFNYMEEYMTEIEQRMLPFVESGEIRRMLVRSPRSFGNLENFNSGIVIFILEDWAKRRSAFDMINDIRAKLADLPGVRAFPVIRQGLGGGTSKPVQFVLGGSTYEELAAWRDIIMEQVEANNPGLVGLDSDYKETRPQIDLSVNYDRAATLGVTIEQIGRTLETMMGGRNVTTFLQRGEEYDVIVEGERESQRSFADIENIYVRSERTGELIPLSNLVSINEYGAAETLSRYNRVRSITLEANLEDGYTLGEALGYLEGLVREHLPEEAIVDYKGQSREFVQSGSSILFIFVLGIIVVFLVMAAQFESYIHPFVIMLTVPLAIGGGLLGLFLTGGTLNIYSQIGLIMLIGLAAKNGILIVEFANQLRDEGRSFREALIEACETRFRPIAMTGLTTIAGSVPLVLSSGAGAETRSVIGIVTLFGVVAATLFTLFIVPVAYDLIARRTSSPQAVEKELNQLAVDENAMNI
ncbi:efflux RND transporter permease subunit [Coraliomargarita algicola]|uniref:Efflux RND transporter permease subunit n=1 Tax=Coraliomargarita algicola TaxID=3092156 RepID=A0ABZ0RGQ7_9BACT|nr:efflux RND transporter permease subunit [Coraliomargarita sp. J2-16]WPJ95354.1 efflux RND transporter permease subunit [Coraliomargarita sp. J2-16]